MLLERMLYTLCIAPSINGCVIVRALRKRELQRIGLLRLLQLLRLRRGKLGFPDVQFPRHREILAR